MAILIDTCALIFVAQRTDSAERAIKIVQTAFDSGEAIYVSPISAWEIGILASKQRLHLAQPPARWFANFMEKAGVSLAALTADILMQSSFLPNSPLRDPADKIIAATARELDYIVLTRDRLMLHYAQQGYMRAVAC